VSAIQQVLLGYGAAGGSGDAVTFDPSAIGPYLTLSSGNLVVTRGAPGNSWSGCRGTLGRNSGKYVFAITGIAGSADGWLCGVASTDWIYDATHIGVPVNGFGLWSNGGECFNSNATVGSAIGAVGTTGTMQFAVDFTAGKIWVGKDNSWDGDPAAGAGNRFSFTPGLTLYPGATLYRLDQSVQLKAASSDYPYSVPSGFSTWGG